MKKIGRVKANHVTLDRIALVLNVEPRWINRLVKEQDFPREARGQYDLVKCVHWYIDHLKYQINQARDKGVPNIEQRLKEVELKIKEYDLAKREGELIPKTFALALYTRILKTLIDRRRQMGTKVAAQFEGDIAHRIKELIDKENADIDREIERNRHARTKPGAELRQLAGGGRIRKQNPKTLPPEGTSDVKPMVRRASGSKRRKRT